MDKWGLTKSELDIIVDVTVAIVVLGPSYVRVIKRWNMEHGRY